MNIKIKKLDPKAVIPKKAHDIDSGYDFTATSVKFEDGKYIYGTGIAVSIPVGYTGFLFMRSSVRKTPLILANAVGVIDPGYHGEVMFTFRPIEFPAPTLKQVTFRPIEFPEPTFNQVINLLDYSNLKLLPYSVGDRIGQLIIVKTEDIQWEEVDSFEDSDRGDKGHGSTGW